MSHHATYVNKFSTAVMRGVF